MSTAAESLLAEPRHPLDRYYSLARMSAIAIEPLTEDTQKRTRILVAEVRGDGRSEYRPLAYPEHIHGVAGSVSGHIAAIGRHSVEIFRSGAEARSIDISKATGWNTEIEFLKNRPVLIVLDDSGITTIDVEH